jgi:release factor glutamine methyltransferase
VFAEEEAELLIEAAGDSARLAALIDARGRGEPLEHLVGWVTFGGVRVMVRPGVFIPRQRTQVLVRLAAELARTGAQRTPTPRVLDLCCGSGALGLTLAELARPLALELVACDLDPIAVACATENLRPLGATVLCGDLFAALRSDQDGAARSHRAAPPEAGSPTRFDLILANAPYVPADQVALTARESREHEPRHTVVGGPTGLEIQSRIAAEAPTWLASGGTLLIESSGPQAEELASTLRRYGLTSAIHRDEEYGATVVTGQAPS